MARLGLRSAKQLKNGAVILGYGHESGERSQRIVPAGGVLSLGQAAMLCGTNLLRVWRAMRAKRLPARKRGGRWTVTVKDAGVWGRKYLKAGS